MAMKIPDQIIRLFKENGGRLSVPQISKLLGRQEQTIYKYVSYLENKKVLVIYGYTHTSAIMYRMDHD